MQRSSWTLGLYLLLVFSSGVLVGGFGHRFYAVKTVSANTPSQQSPAEVRQKYVNRMQARLKLTPEQTQQMHDILIHTHGEYWAYRDRHRAELKSIQDDQIARVKTILKPEQLPEYEKVIAEQNRERRSKEERERRSN